MDHPMAVSADQYEVLQLCLLSRSLGQRCCVVTLDESVSPLTVYDREIEPADFACELPSLLHDGFLFRRNDLYGCVRAAYAKPSGCVLPPLPYIVSIVLPLQ